MIAPNVLQMRGISKELIVRKIKKLSKAGKW